MEEKFLKDKFISLLVHKGYFHLSGHEIFLVASMFMDRYKMNDTFGHKCEFTFPLK